MDEASAKQRDLAEPPLVVHFAVINKLSPKAK